MAVLDPIFINLDNVYGADELGLPFRDIMGEGIVEASDLLVAQRAAGANMSVDIAAGAAWVKGDDNANAQPTYRLRNDAVVNLVVAGADPADPRKDIVVARVYDSVFAGASDMGALEVIAGTPAPAPSEPALPNGSLKLAVVDVAAGATSVVNANITDSRTSALVGAGVAGASAPTIGYGTSLPGSPADGDEFVLVDSVSAPTYQWRFRYNAGSSSAHKWEFVGGAAKLVTVVTDQSTATSGSWVDLATVGPSFTVPNAGDWEALYTADAYHSVAGGQSFIGPAVGAGTPGDNKAMAFVNAGQQAGFATGIVRFLNLSASDEIRLRYFMTTTGTGNWTNRKILVRPVRVS